MAANSSSGAIVLGTSVNGIGVIRSLGRPKSLAIWYAYFIDGMLFDEFRKEYRKSLLSSNSYGTRTTKSESTGFSL